MTLYGNIGGYLLHVHPSREAPSEQPGVEPSQDFELVPHAETGEKWFRAWPASKGVDNTKDHALNLVCKYSLFFWTISICFSPFLRASPVCNSDTVALYGKLLHESIQRGR